MHGAASQSRGPGVVDAQLLRPLRRLQPHVELALGGPPGHPLELELALRVLRVLDEEVPARALVVPGGVEVGELAVDGLVTVVVAGVDEQRGEARTREVGRQGSAPGAAADDDVVVLLSIRRDVGRQSG